MPRNPRSSLAERSRAAAAVVSTLLLGACASWPGPDDTPDTDELLRNSLPVAAAALGAGQLEVARRLYLSLEERFETAPEPVLGLAYVAFQSGDFVAAERHFLQAADRASKAPAVRAEALLGAGRTALVRNRTGTARRHFRRATSSGQDTPPAAWIANGLGVVATLSGDYERAEAHYAEALRRSAGHPRIAANHVRMLVAAGRIDDAARVYAARPPTWWANDDGPALSRLIEEARRKRSRSGLAVTTGRARDSRTETSELRSGATPPQPGRETPRSGSTGPVPPRTEQEDPGIAPEPGPLDPDLTMRLRARPPEPARPSTVISLPAGVTSPEPSSLVLRLDPWSAPPEPVRAVNDPAPAPGVTVAQSDPPAPGPMPPGSGTTERPVPADAGAATATAGPHAVPRNGEPVLATLDSSSGSTFALILGQSRRLQLNRHASSVLVTSPEVADVRLLSPDVVYVIGKGVGRTSVAVLDDDERVDEWVVSVVLDLEPLRTVLAGEPDLGGVHARRLLRGVALTGVVDSAAAADRALRLAAGALPEGVPIENDLRIASPLQVNLEVQIAEVHRSVTENLGVNWEAFTVRGNEGFGLRIGRVIGGSPDVPYPGLVPPVPVDTTLFPPTIVDGQSSPSVYFGRSSANTRIAAMVDALATAGLANVLARPNVTAVSGESASFFSGGEFPLPTGFDNGVLVFEYKKYGVLLDFVPTVVDAGRIVLTVRPEVSEPSRSQSVTIIQGVSVPVINVRRAETTVEVADGESIVIAGLFRNASNTVEAGLPGLKDLPLLGLLFGTTSIRSDELELIVIVTARLVEAHASTGDTGEPPATLNARGYHY